MSEPNEQEDHDDAVSEPVAPGTVSDEEAAEEEAHDAETDAGEAGDGESGALEHVHFPGDEQERREGQKAQRDEQKAIEKMFKLFGGEQKRHDDRVRVIAGDSYDELLPCPMCLPDEGQPHIAGFLLPVPPSDDKIAAIRQAIGLAPKIDYAEDPYSKVCPVCRGFKLVLPTGAAENIPPLPCAECKSAGWLPVGEKRGGAPENGARADWRSEGVAQPVQIEADPPEVAALKAAGYTVIEPFRATA